MSEVHLTNRQAKALRVLDITDAGLAAELKGKTITLLDALEELAAGMAGIHPRMQCNILERITKARAETTPFPKKRPTSKDKEKPLSLRKLLSDGYTFHGGPALYTETAAAKLIHLLKKSHDVRAIEAKREIDKSEPRLYVVKRSN